MDTITAERFLLTFLIFLLGILTTNSDSIAFNCKKSVQCHYQLNIANLKSLNSRNEVCPGTCSSGDTLENGTRIQYDDQVQVNRFPNYSLWIGVWIRDMHGIALSPLFTAHDKLSCTEFIITQLHERHGISLGMRYFQKRKLTLSSTSMPLVM